MEWFIYPVIWAVGVLCGMLAFKALEKAADEKERVEAAHRAAEQRALSRLRRSESAKAAAERRKQGVTGKDIVQELVSPSDAADTAESQMNVDQSLYGRVGVKDGLPH